MSLAEADNFLRLVHKAIWSALEASGDFTNLVPANNRIKHVVTNHYPDIRNVPTKAHTPFVRVVEHSLTPMLQTSSDSSECTARYEIEVKTGDQSGIMFLDLASVILRAWSKWETYLKTQTWKSKTFVHNAQPRQVVFTFDEKSNRGMLGWATVWSFDVLMHFTTSDLQA